jgi:hypothetical protein
MLYARREYATAGDFCRPCLTSAFWHHTLRNVTLGWWGTISFVMTWVFLFGNIATYARARQALAGLRASVASEPLPASGEEAQQLLARFEHNVRLRLREGENVRDVAGDLARVHDVTLNSAEHFVETLAAAERSAA